MCDVNSCNVFLLLFIALWVLISATLFRRAVLVLWHAFMFLLFLVRNENIYVIAPILPIPVLYHTNIL
jgi:hypothetical protein